MKKQAILIGGAHIDIAGMPLHKLRKGEKNHGNVTFTAGGVAFNTARYLSRLGIDTSLITLACDDAHAEIVRQACTRHNIDISHSLQLNGCSTPKYLYISDVDGETYFGISDIQMYEKITPAFLQTKIDLINTYSLCYIDANLSREALEYLMNHVTIPVVIDPVSPDHCAKLTDMIHKAYAIKPNEKELKALCGISPDTESGMQAARKHFIAKGVKEVYFSLGERGLFYGNADASGQISHRIENIINTNGAGDAMTAGIIYGLLNGYEIEKTALCGTAAACISLQSSAEDESTITEETLLKKMEEIK